MLYFFAIAAPIKLSGQAEIEHTALPMALDDLPLGAYIVGDAEKTLTDECLTPFTGFQQADPKKDDYNFS